MGGSSSHRRKNSHHPRSSSSYSRLSNAHNSQQQQRSAAVAVPVPIPTARTLTFEQLAITEGPGFNLLCKSGWTPGQTLGLSPNHSNSAFSMPSISTSSLPCSNLGDSHPQNAHVFADSAPSSSTSALSAPLPIVVRQGRHGVGAGSGSGTPTANHFAQSAPATLKGRGRSYKPQQSSCNRNKKYQGHSHPRFQQRRNKNTTATTNEMGMGQDEEFISKRESGMVSPTLVKQLANLDIFDPLRPRCQYDPDHVVRDLKALHKHELTCPANPCRETSASLHRLSTSPFTPPTMSRLHSINRNRLSFSSIESLQDEEDDDLSLEFSTSPLESSDDEVEDEDISSCTASDEESNQANINNTDHTDGDEEDAMECDE